MPSEMKVSASEMERRKNVANIIQNYLDGDNPDRIKMSVEDLAKKAGTTHPSLYHLLNKRRGLGRRLATKLVSAGVSSKLLSLAAGFAMDGDNPSATVLLLSQRIAKLSPEKRRVVEDVLDGLSGTVKKRK